MQVTEIIFQIPHHIMGSRGSELILIPTGNGSLFEIPEDICNE
jgi:hypothetical protein